MASEMEGAGAGAGGGAIQGAAVGTQISPGWGTVIGAGVGAIAGGASGFFGTRGANKRRAAKKKAQHRYNDALQSYKDQSLANEFQYRGNMEAVRGQRQADFQGYINNLPGDQSGTLQNDYQDQLAALQAPSINTGPVSGNSVLANNYAAEGQQRNLAALAPMASNYAGSNQGTYMDNSDRGYGMSNAALANNYRNHGTYHDVTQSEYNRSLSVAKANYNRRMHKAKNAGSEDMMYAGMINAGMSMAGGMGGMGGMGGATPSTGTGAAFSGGAGSTTPYGGSNSQMLYNP